MMMQLVYLHGFATTVQIWGKKDAGFFPELELEDLASESRRIAGLIEDNAVLIGWSMGGMLALLIAAEFPAKIKGLILISSTPKFLQGEGYQQGLSESVLRLLQKKINSEGIGAFHSLMFGSQRPAGLAAIDNEKARKGLAELARVDLRPYLKKIKVPTLIIHGDADRICLPAASELMHHAIAGSRLEILPNIGHAPMIEAPARLDQLIKQFVKDNVE